MTISSMTAIPVAYGALRFMAAGSTAQIGGAIDWVALFDKGGVVAVLGLFCWMLYRNDQTSRKKFDKQQELIVRALEQSTASQRRSAAASEFCEQHNREVSAIAHNDADRAHADAGDAREELFRQERKHGKGT